MVNRRVRALPLIRIDKIRGRTGSEDIYDEREKERERERERDVFEAVCGCLRLNWCVDLAGSLSLA